MTIKNQYSFWYYIKISINQSKPCWYIFVNLRKKIILLILFGWSILVHSNSTFTRFFIVLVFNLTKNKSITIFIITFFYFNVWPSFYVLKERNYSTHSLARDGFMNLSSVRLYIWLLIWSPYARQILPTFLAFWFTLLFPLYLNKEIKIKVSNHDINYYLIKLSLTKRKGKLKSLKPQIYF